MSAIKGTWPLAVEVLARGGTHAEAGRAAGVRRETVTGWLKDRAEVADAVVEARAAFLEETTGTLISATTRAAQILIGIADDASVPAQFRAAAAGKVLEYAARYRNELTVEERLRALETRVNLE